MLGPGCENSFGPRGKRQRGAEKGKKRALMNKNKKHLQEAEAGLKKIHKH